MENTPCKQSNDLLQVSPTGKSYRLFLSRELALQQQLLITAYMYVEAGQTFMQHPYYSASMQHQDTGRRLHQFHKDVLVRHLSELLDIYTLLEVGMATSV